MRKLAGSFALAVLLAVAPALAQGPNAPTPAQQQGQKAREDGGTSPENMGATGWTGPHKGQQTGTTDGARNQPLMATGIDLRGQPRRFAPRETPE